MSSKEICVINNNKFNTNCSTITFVCKTFDTTNYKYTVDELLIKFPESKKTKFRNCVIYKIDDVCVKIYTNQTLQLNGIKSVDSLGKIFEKLNLTVKYKVNCVMSNWCLKLSNETLDLNTIMDSLNNLPNFTAYFLRGYPLIIKYQCFYQQNYYIIGKTDNNSVNLEFFDNGEKVKSKITVLLFKSGNCIVSGPSEEQCVYTIQMLKKYI